MTESIALMIKEKLWDCRKRDVKPVKIKMDYDTFNTLLAEGGYRDVIAHNNGVGKPVGHSIYGVEIELVLRKTWMDAIEVIVE